MYILHVRVKGGGREKEREKGKGTNCERKQNNYNVMAL